MIGFDVTGFGRKLERFERPTPAPSGREVLLRTLAAGVCHTDIHTRLGWYDLGQGRRLSMSDRGLTLPLTLGHEVVGTPVAVGEAVGEVAVGRNYLLFPWIGCGDCRQCRRGRETLCGKPRYHGIFRPGGYSDHVLVPDARYLIDIGDLDPAAMAPLACSGLTTYSALRKVDPDILAEEPTLLFGCGGLGLMAIALVTAMGGRGVIAIDLDPAKRAAALAAGALAAIDGAAPDLTAQVQEVAGGPVWTVIDCVGAPQTLQAGIGLLAKGGRIVVIGLFGGDTPLPIPLLPLKAMTLQGSYVGSLEELQALVGLVRDRGLGLIPTHRRPLDDAEAALHDLEAGRVAGRIVLQPSAPEAAF